jgi:hypothetical protein
LGAIGHEKQSRSLARRRAAPRSAMASSVPPARTRPADRFCSVGKPVRHLMPGAMRSFTKAKVELRFASGRSDIASLALLDESATMVLSSRIAGRSFPIAGTYSFHSSGEYRDRAADGRASRSDRVRKRE